MGRELHGKEERASHDDVMGHDFHDNMSLVSNLSFVQIFFWDFCSKAVYVSHFPFLDQFLVYLRATAIYRVPFVLDHKLYPGSFCNISTPRDSTNYHRLQRVRVNGAWTDN